MSLNQVRIVLVRPEEAGNVGAAARVAKNFGLSHLVLVAPRLNRPEAAYRWARGAEEVVEGAEMTDTLGEAVSSCSRAFAVTRRQGKFRGRAMKPDQAATDMWSLARSGQPTALVFGPESRGLNNDDVAECSDRILIPTSPQQPSLNLAQAVAVCTYEIFRASITDHQDLSLHQEALLEERHGLYAHLEKALLDVGFLFPHTSRSRMSVIKDVLERARLKPSEARLFRGIARQVERAGKIMEEREGGEKAEGGRDKENSQAADC